MNETKRKYKHKLKVREVTFYLHEKPLYDFSKTINFSKLVKDTLKNEMQKPKLQRKVNKDFKTSKDLAKDFIKKLNETIERAKNGNRTI